MKTIKNEIRKDKAITLIALVITIVVLIILASVAISLSLGENGLFNKAKTATEEYTNAQKTEEIEIENYSNDIELFSRSGNVSTYRETIIYEGNTKPTSITFNNGHSIDEFDSIKFLYGVTYESGKWDQLCTQEFSKKDWNFIIENQSTAEYVMGLYGYASRQACLYNFSKTGFSIRSGDEYYIARIYGINY